ncbi:MAG TPA: rhomboid family intramembrane serine protease [Bacteroidia bacterium]|nr:rhomboid family intramembrane serine protease [Bacteroidia bacterium]
MNSDIAILTFAIIAVTSIFSIIAFSNPSIFHNYLFNAYALNHDKKQWYRFFTHAFLHADYMHLFFNMFVLYSFGSILENYFFRQLFANKSEFYFLLLYIGGIMASSFPSFEKHKNNPNYNSVGASGAVSAVVFSCILIGPKMPLNILFIPFDIPAYIFGALYLAYEWYMGKRQSDNIGHDAHFWGAVFGFGFTVILKPALFLLFFQQIFN